MFVVARTPDDVIGASAEVDDGDEDAESQLAKPSWNPVSQYASVLLMCCTSIQKQLMEQAWAELNSMSIGCSNCLTWIQHKSCREVKLRKHYRIAHWWRCS